MRGRVPVRPMIFLIAAMSSWIESRAVSLGRDRAPGSGPLPASPSPRGAGTKRNVGRVSRFDRDEVPERGTPRR